jgi:hypothetical protein
LVGCGLAVPDIKEAWDQDIPPGTLSPDQKTKVSGTAQMEFEIRKRIFCELRDAVQAVNEIPWEVDGKSKPVLPADWGANVAISLQVDESSAISPGVSLNTPMHNGIVNFAGEYLGPTTVTGAGLLTAAPATQTFGPLAMAQSYAFGLGGTLSSTATRIDKFNAFWPVGYLMQRVKDSSKFVCAEDPFLAKGISSVSSSPLTSDLGIKEWLEGVMMGNRLLPSVDVPQNFAGGGTSPKGSKSSGGASSPIKQADTVSEEIKFVIVSNGNVTPAWKLVRVSANNNSTLFATGRTRTHDLIITIGPVNETSASTFLASQIGQAVSGGNRSQLPVQ